MDEVVIMNDTTNIVDSTTRKMLSVRFRIRYARH